VSTNTKIRREKKSTNNKAEKSKILYVPPRLPLCYTAPQSLPSGPPHASTPSAAARTSDGPQRSSARAAATREPNRSRPLRLPAASSAPPRSLASPPSPPLVLSLRTRARSHSPQPTRCLPSRRRLLPRAGAHHTPPHTRRQHRAAHRVASSAAGRPASPLFMHFRVPHPPLSQSSRAPQSQGTGGD
jgi:hypothetical protein